MNSGPSLLSLAASAFYILVAAACIGSAVTARQYRQPPRFGHTWLLLVVLFVALAAMRLTGAEEGIRDVVREAMRQGGDYADRRGLQVPVIGALILLVGTGGLLWIYRITRHPQGKRAAARIVAVTSAIVLLFLVGLRLFSLHSIDALLYGPLKLNWVIDIGASLAVMLAALRYVQLVRART